MWPGCVCGAPACSPDAPVLIAHPPSDTSGAVPLGTCGISAAFRISGPPPTISWTGTAEIPLWPAGAVFWTGPYAWYAPHSPDLCCVAQGRPIGRGGTPTASAGRGVFGLHALPEDVPCHMPVRPRRCGGAFGCLCGARGIPGPPPGTSGAAHVRADAQKPYICTRTAPLTKTEAEPYGFTEYRDWFIMFIYINPTQHDKWKEKQFMLSCCPLQWWQVE